MNSKLEQLTVSIDGTDLSLNVPVGGALLETLDTAGVFSDTQCGGLGVCGKCRVQFKSGMPQPNDEETHLIDEGELVSGWRLACQTSLTEDCTIYIPSVVANSALRVLTNASSEKGISLPTDDKRFESGYGIAVDLGTTTVACYLIELHEGRRFDVAAFANPQRQYGADVISRINYTREDSSHLSKLQNVIVSEIEDQVNALCKRNEIVLSELVRMTVVGNSTMMHIFWGVDPWSLGVAPYKPEFTESTPRTANKIGFKRFKDMVVEMLPGIGGHLGSDTVGGLVTFGSDAYDEPFLFLDLGTNGEIVLVKDGEAIGCTCAAGPAFEGVHILCGTPAIDGAIDHMSIDNGKILFSTIGAKSPVGLCGSGLVDCVSELIRMGIVSKTGRFVKPDQMPGSIPPGLKNRLIKADKGGWRFVIAEKTDGSPVFISQTDIRQMQLAKAAFRTGIDYLLREAGLNYLELSKVYVGGGFGSHLRMEGLTTMGLWPSGLDKAVEAVGNVAGLGAHMALMSKSKFADSLRVGHWVSNLSLESKPDFNGHFIENLSFPGIADD